MVIVDQQRAHQRVLYEQTNMTVQQASSQQLLFPLVCFFSATEMELIEELKLALWFCFEDTSESCCHFWYPVND
jgi:DNA mismatch repair protein MutL